MRPQRSLTEFEQRRRRGIPWFHEDVAKTNTAGQIKSRRIDAWRKIAAVLSQHTAVAA
jgi:hypothetical protein